MNRTTVSQAVRPVHHTAKPLLLQVTTKEGRRAADHIHNAVVELFNAQVLTEEDVKLIVRKMRGVQKRVVYLTLTEEERVAQATAKARAIIVDSTGTAFLPEQQGAAA